MVDSVNPRAESNWAKSEKMDSRRGMKLPRRTECVIRIPIRQNVNRKEEGHRRLSFSGRKTDDYMTTGVLNTNENEVQPIIVLQEIELNQRAVQNDVNYEDREKAILVKLRLEHINTEERKLLVETGDSR
jgi:hypothetical protein